MRPGRYQGGNWRGDGGRRDYDGHRQGPRREDYSYSGFRPPRQFSYNSNNSRFRQSWNQNDYRHQPSQRYDHANSYQNYSQGGHRRSDQYDCETRPSNYRRPHPQDYGNATQSRRRSTSKEPVETGHRPPASDHYQNAQFASESFPESFKTNLHETVDIVKKRILDRKEGGYQVRTPENSILDNKDDDSFKNSKPVKLRRNNRSHSRNSDSQACSEYSDTQKVTEMKSNIVEQLFKMDKTALQKVVVDPTSSNKFEYAIHSLITESRNSLNRHLRSTAAKSLSVQSDNDTIFEDTFMKQMQCILNPEDAVILTDMKPMIMAEIKKILDLPDSDSVEVDQFLQNVPDRDEHTNLETQHYTQNPALKKEFSNEDSEFFKNFYSEDAQEIPINPDLFDRDAYVRLKPEAECFESFTDDEDPFIGSKEPRSEPEVSVMQTNNNEWNRNSFGSEIDTLITETDIIESIKPESSAQNNDFDQNELTATTPQGEFDLINYVNTSDEVQEVSSTGHDLADNTESNNRNNIEYSLQKSDKGAVTSYDNRDEHKTKKTLDKPSQRDHSSGRKKAQQVSNKKDKHKNTSSLNSESKRNILNKNIIINVNDCPKRNSDIDDNKVNATKSVFNLYFAKDDSKKSKSDSNKSKNKSSKSSRQEKISETKSPLKTFDIFNSQSIKKEPNTGHKPIFQDQKKPKSPTKEVKVVKDYKERDMSIFGRIKKRVAVSTQTIHPKTISRVIQTNVMVVRTVSTQTDNSLALPNVKKSTDAFERMKEIDLEIQMLLQEKFKLYPNIEEKGINISRMPELGMAVLNVDNAEIDIEDMVDGDTNKQIGIVFKQERIAEAEVLIKKEKSVAQNLSKTSDKTTNELAVSPGEHEIPKPSKLPNKSKNRKNSKSVVIEKINEEKSAIPEKTKRDLFKKYDIKPCSVVLKKLDEPISGLDSSIFSTFTLDEDDCLLSSIKSWKPQISVSLRMEEQQPSLNSEEIISQEKSLHTIPEGVKIERKPEEVEKKLTSNKRKRKLVEKYEEPPPIIYEKRTRKKTEKAAAAGIEIATASTRSRRKKEAHEPKESDVDYVPGMSGIDLENNEDFCTEIIVDGSFDIDRPLLIKNFPDYSIELEVPKVDHCAPAQEAAKKDKEEVVEKCTIYDFSAEESRCDSLKLMGHDDSIIAIEPVKENFLAASTDGNVYYFSSETGRLITTLRGSNLPVTCLNVVEDTYGTTVYTGSLDSRIRYYNLATGLEKGLECNVLSPIQTMDRAWNTIFVGTKTGFVLQFECKSCGEEINTALKLRTVNNYMLVPVSSIKFSEQAILALKALKEGPRKVLLVAARSESVTVKDAQTGLLLRTLEGPKMTVYSLLFEEGKVFCGTSTSQIQVFDFSSGNLVGTHNGGKGAVCIKSKNGLLFAGCYDGCIYVYRHHDEHPFAQLRGPNVMLLSIVIVKDKIIAGYKDRTLFMWNIPPAILEEMIL